MKLPPALFNGPSERPKPRRKSAPKKVRLTEDYYAPQGVWRTRQAKPHTPADVARQPSYLYVFVHAHQNRIKIGRSDEPLRRMASLPEVDDIDQTQSLRFQLPDRRRACEVESMLHRALAGYRLQLTLLSSASLRRYQNEGWDGRTEWFALSGLRHALGLLQALPESTASQTNRLETLDGKPYLTDVQMPYASEAERLQQEAYKHNLRQLDHVCDALMQISRHRKISWRDNQPGTSLGLPIGGILRIHGYKSWWNLESSESVKGISDPALWNLKTGRQPRPARTCRRSDKSVRTDTANSSVAGLVALIRFASDDRQDLELVFNPASLVGNVPGGPEINRRWVQMRQVLVTGTRTCSTLQSR